jgi:hypothetical protein
MSLPVPSSWFSWSAGVQGVRKGCKKRGRPSQQLPAEAVARFRGVYSTSEVRQGAAYSSTKRLYRCMCKKSRHLSIRADDTVSRSLRTLRCRMCKRARRLGSSYEDEAYSLLDDMAEITEYAAEVHAVQCTVDFEGGQLEVGNHRWDILVLQPARVLLEVQGEQHDDIPDTRQNSISADLDSSMARDRALAAAAVEQGFYVVWLRPKDPTGRRDRWRAGIQQALAAAVNKEECKLHMT